MSFSVSVSANSDQDTFKHYLLDKQQQIINKLDEYLVNELGKEMMQLPKLITTTND